VQSHHWSLSDLERLPVWELDVYIDMLEAEIKRQEEQAKYG
jgi:hypothetical protein